MLSRFRAFCRPLVLVHYKNYCSKSKSGCSHIRLDFDKELEEEISKQLNEELKAAYAYYSMAAVFGRDDVALPGFNRLFNEFAQEEIDHATGWVKYLNLRGGRAKFHALPAVPDFDWTPLCATEKALEMEMEMTKNLLKLRELADKHHDPHLTKHVEDDYLIEQYDGLKKLGDLKTQILRVADGMGLYLLDHNILAERNKGKEK